jgi:hypothetical protein
MGGGTSLVGGEDIPVRSKVSISGSTDSDCCGSGEMRSGCGDGALYGEGVNPVKFRDSISDETGPLGKERGDLLREVGASPDLLLDDFCSFEESTSDLLNISGMSVS